VFSTIGRGDPCSVVAVIFFFLRSLRADAHSAGHDSRLADRARSG
jgi:hypothetical protein